MDIKVQGSELHHIFSQLSCHCLVMRLGDLLWTADLFAWESTAAESSSLKQQVSSSSVENSTNCYAICSQYLELGPRQNGGGDCRHMWDCFMVAGALLLSK